MPSEFYNQNWERSNEWLKDNAPEYVLECIREMAEALKAQQEYVKMLSQIVNTQNTDKRKEFN